MTGPPTPPATSAVELQDQARSEKAQVQAQGAASTSAPDVSAASPTLSENRPEIYQNVIPSMVEAIKKKDFETLVQITSELDFATASDRQPSRLLVVAPLVLGYLILDDTSAAKYALLRLSDNLLNVALSRSLQSLIIATINREHAKVYDQANALQTAIAREFTDKQFAPIITSLLAAFVEGFRRRTLNLLSRAYTSLPLKLACVYLGWQETEVIKVAEMHGWTYEGSTKMFSPHVQIDTTTKDLSSFSSLDTFHFVADSVGKLEI